jgi:glyoxylate carboligase
MQRKTLRCSTHEGVTITIGDDVVTLDRKPPVAIQKDLIDRFGAKIESNNTVRYHGKTNVLGIGDENVRTESTVFMDQGKRYIRISVKAKNAEQLFVSGIAPLKNALDIFEINAQCEWDYAGELTLDNLDEDPTRAPVRKTMVQTHFDPMDMKQRKIVELETYREELH